MTDITPTAGEKPDASRTMDDEAAFLRAICEHPDEDTPRLVFADWLTEQGGAVNVAWANGIRAQVWLARGATDEALAFQTCVFDSRFGQEKLRERLDLPPELDSPPGIGSWERGFPSQAHGIFSQLRDVWPGLAFRIPIRKLYIHELTGADVGEFVTWPALTVVRELACTGVWNAPRVDVIRTLAGCAALRDLKTLHLHNVLTTDATVTALLTSPHLAGLEKLRIGYEGSLSALSDAVRSRLVARFGTDVYDDSIPF
jgi:uncharacterized protein (TIGR02996 family)